MSAIFRIWRGDSGGGKFQDYSTNVDPGMVVLDAVHRIQAEQAPDLAVRWNCKAGKCGSCSAEINGMPRLMCMTRLSELNLDMPVILEPMHAFPLDSRSGDGRILELSGQEEDQEVLAPQAGRCRMAPGACSRWTSIACRSSANASSASCARMSAMCCATITSTQSSSDRATWSMRPRSRCIPSIPPIALRNSA